MEALEVETIASQEEEEEASRLTAMDQGVELEEAGVGWVEEEEEVWTGGESEDITFGHLMCVDFSRIMYSWLLELRQNGDYCIHPLC